MSDDLLASGSLLYFMLQRQLHSKATLDVIRPLQMKGGVENECLRNANTLRNRLGYQIVSGWLYISKPNKHNSQVTHHRAQFTQHWWNYDPEGGNFYDLSPNIEPTAIHVLDLGLAKFSAEKFGYLTVAHSILLRDKTFFSLNYSQDGFDISHIAHLNDENLFPPREKHGSLIADQTPFRTPPDE